MSIFDSIKHALVEDDPNASQKPATTTTRPNSGGLTGLPNIPGLPGGIGIPSTPVSSTPVSSPTVAGTVDASLTATYTAKLREKLAAAPVNALLAEFSTTMESLQEDIPQEGNRFRAALKLLAKRSNVTSDQLTASYSSLVDLLNAEESKFSSSVDSQKRNEVEAREQQIQQINSQIDTKNKEIQDLMSQRDGVATDIITAKTHLGAVVASFEGALASLQAEVGDSIQKLKIYFPPAAVNTAKK